MGRILSGTLFLLLIVVVVLGGLLAWGYGEYSKAGPSPGPTTVLVPRGAGVTAIADKLAEQGVIARPLVFVLGARLTRVDTALKAGEYLIPAGASPREVAAILKSGETVVRRLTVAEGLTSAQVTDVLRATEGLDGPVPTPLAEGSVLPETYHFSFGDSRAELVGRMRRDLDRTLADLWAARQPDLPLKSPEEALILASIVERETAVPEERPRIAAVFVNRLNRGMRLQSDPTAAYGLAADGRPLDRPLTRADLKSQTPYNTYVINGLPPGPICNPGRESIAAVLNPAQSKDLYFVADGTGGHVFARTLAEHNRNVARWRKINRERGN